MTASTALLCGERGCSQQATFKCERCSKRMCLQHHSRVRGSYGAVAIYCPNCAHTYRKWLSAAAVFAIAAIGLPISLLLVRARK